MNIDFNEVFAELLLVFSYASSISTPSQKLNLSIKVTNGAKLWPNPCVLFKLGK